MNRRRMLLRGSDRAGRVGVVVAAAAVAAVTAAALAAAATAPSLHFTVAAKTPLKLTDVVWSGSRFFYVDNTTNRVFAADRKGAITGLFATMPNIVEETRCVVSPARWGWPKGGLYCHSPDNKIYRITPAGEVSVLATLPETEISDGALAVDLVGKFGHRLVAATGRSATDGGSVFTIGASGTVRKIGTYPGPGGADNLVVAPARFGSASGSALLAVDNEESKNGSVVAFDAAGTAKTIAQLPDGPNPIAVIPQRLRRTGSPRAGFYVVDTFPGTVLLATADQFAGHGGEVIVGSEIRGLIWLLAPSGSGFTATQLKTNLDAKGYNLEGAKFVP